MSEFNIPEHVLPRIAELEREVSKLKILRKAEVGPPPMERGRLFFPEGDFIPPQSIADNYEGKFWDFDGTPLQFKKNNTKQSLAAGQAIFAGKVDEKIGQQSVFPGNFFFLEIC